MEKIKFRVEMCQANMNMTLSISLKMKRVQLTIKILFPGSNSVQSVVLFKILNDMAVCTPLDL